MKLPRPTRALLALALAGSPARAALADEPAAPTQAQIDEAKRFFEQGESLRAAGQYQAALEAYLKSRAVVPRATNTLNAGVCLYALKRYDEAYDYFEEALGKYPEAQLPAVARDSAKKTMADIEAKVGRVDVSANVDGTLVIDGRSRGKLPLIAPVRVMPGKHVVRVLRDGFGSFEATVQVAAGETAKVDAKLEALAAAGRLRVEGPAELEGGDVLIDGAAVGALPWEGTLQPGTHIYQVIKGGVGTGPRLAVVIVGQTVKKTVEASPLGPERRVVLEPATAELSIDGIALGKGRFQGRLPVGKHVVEAREEGYLSARVPFEVTAADASDFPVKLTVDATHPRWAVNAPKARFALGALFGWQFASSFGNDSTVWCKTASPCEQKTPPSGVRFGVGGVYELPSQLGVHLEAGYSSLTRSLERKYDRSAPLFPQLHYDLQDEFRLSSFWLAAGLGYRLKLGDRFDLSARVMVSGLRTTTKFTSTGTLTDGKTTLPTKTDNSGTSLQSVMIDVIPDVALGVWIGSHLRTSVGLALPISVLRGARLSPGDTRQQGSCDRTKPDTLDCVAGQRFDADDSSVSSVFLRFVPQASIAYWF